MQATTIVVLGDINLDLTINLPILPTLGDDLPVAGVVWHRGGTGLNTALALLRLGAEVRLLGRVGNDPATTQIMASEPACRLDQRWLQTDPLVATGLCTVLVTPDGQRTFISARGANVYYDPEAFDPAVLDGCDLLFVCGHALLEGAQQAAALRTIKLAFERGLPVALDLCLPTIRAASGLIHHLLPQLWLLTLNEAELQALLPELSHAAGLAELATSGIRYLGLKRGARGCSVVGANEQVDRMPPSVMVVDTNGCGDAFAASLAWSLRQGAKLADGATLANLMGALTATRSGAADALPSRTELLAQLEPGLHWLLDEERIPL
ncbi:MAG: carbohydrate kinase family protein [Oscillochloridaceae bacterium umkhey_bin13]